jgi:hypothetical protein
MLEDQKNKEAPLLESQLASTIGFEGHPGDVRFVGLSYDDAQILSVSTSIFFFLFFSFFFPGCVAVKHVTRVVPYKNVW